MKLIHMSDLHIGKRLNEFSLIDDQKYILNQILNIIDEESPDAILISGDVYDKSLPSAQAVEVLDKFICAIAKRRIETFIISGNHDSAERMSFASSLIDVTGIHISPVYNGNVDKRIMSDEYGTVNIYMLPFIKPINIKTSFGIDDTISYNDAVGMAIDNMNVNTEERNIILSHQFVTGASRCDSEDLSVGGSDGVSASLYDCFDYVALGHIHSPQRVVRDTLRYSGTPLKYSFSEVGHKKSVTVIELFEKGNISLKTVELIPKRDMVKIKGSYDEIISRDYYEKLSLDNYYHITLTDENDVVDALSKLRTVYKNIMQLEYDNKRTRSISTVTSSDNPDKSPLELVQDLYFEQNAAELDINQSDYVKKAISEIWG